MISLHLKNSTEHSWVNTKGQFNCLNSFAYKLWYNTGELSWEGYCIDGKRHNPKGPVYRSWYKNGQLYHEEYRINGKLHNLKGPAHKSWNENGQLSYEGYWLEGKEVDKSILENLD